MQLTGLEREFCRLVADTWASPPLFDHSLVAPARRSWPRQTDTPPTGSLLYEITDVGRAAICNE